MKIYEKAARGLCVTHAESSVQDIVGFTERVMSERRSNMTSAEGKKSDWRKMMTNSAEISVKSLFCKSFLQTNSFEYSCSTFNTQCSPELTLIHMLNPILQP